MRLMFASRVHFQFKYGIDLPKCQNTSLLDLRRKYCINKTWMPLVCIDIQAIIITYKCVILCVMCNGLKSSYGSNVGYLGWCQFVQHP